MEDYKHLFAFINAPARIRMRRHIQHFWPIYTLLGLWLFCVLGPFLFLLH